MLYLGYPISLEEALRLFSLDKSLVSTFYHTEPVQAYLKKKNSHLLFFYIDKGSCFLGLSLSDSFVEYETAVTEIIGLRRILLSELRNLGVDLSRVELTRIEEEGFWVENPEPFLMSI